MFRLCLALAAAASVSACGDATSAPPENIQVDMRNLVDTLDPAPGLNHHRGGELIPTPSDTASRYYLIHTRTPLAGPNISIVRQDRGERTVFARVETDCAARRLLIASVGVTRSEVESRVAGNLQLRPIEGRPLREEMATFICDHAGTPLAEA